MTIKPLTTWLCDTCGARTVGVQDGVLIWRRSATQQYVDFRIVHVGDCDPQGGFRSSLRLDSVLGYEGQTRFLAWLSAGAAEDHQREPRVESIAEFVHTFRRLQLPYYEEGRAYFECTDFDANFGSSTVAQYRPENLRWASENIVLER